MIIESAGKYIGGKVVTALCVVASGVTLFYFYKHPEAAANLWQVIKYSVAWIAFSAALPWASLSLLPRVLKTESNLVSALLLAGLTGLDVLMALWLCGWHVQGGALAWTVLLLGFITAGAYNFVVCESLARWLES